MGVERSTRFPRVAAAGSLLVIALLALAMFSGCAQEDLPQDVWDRAHPRGSLASGDAGAAPFRDAGTADQLTESGTEVEGRCLQALAQRLPARLGAMKAVVASAGPPAPPTVTVWDWQIADKLEAHCAGACHTRTNPIGGFVVTQTSDLRLPAAGKQHPPEGFKNRGDEALWHIRADGLDSSRNPMPPFDYPEGMSWTERSALPDADDIVVLAGWLDAWLAAGAPSSFTLPLPPIMTPVPAVDAGAGAASSYLMAPAVGNGMTNLGNCIPEKALVASEQDESLALDRMFAGLQKAPKGQGSSQERIGLPRLLSETDLTTFDSEKLARMGVVAFVPAYPLWSDNAGKIRHVRVPRGQSIQFDNATQRFAIPPNTRFYKTFLKRIVDVDGNESWRKIETRLIVSRPDPDAALAAPELDATKINALFGIYQWNDDETEATLVDESLTDQEGFKDTLVQYDVDPTLAAGIRASFPDDGAGRQRAARALNKAGAVRHYAMPNSQRCIHCHMGSSSRSFVLGFMPVQLVHRPLGEGGTIEPSGVDEMTQFERLVDYGIISGVTSRADVLPLEASQGDRKPRNDHELVAQGYMLGNCAHCHNPRGFPSVSFDHVLEPMLDFLPSATGGIFQFPLDRTSPRIKRGIRGDIAIPYITPSLVDSPDSPNGEQQRNDNDPNIGIANVWVPKWRVGVVPPFIYAPWRSLVYRNVDTPFSYADDYAMFPHMPMDVPGYDCRAKRILGDWMVSIPGKRSRADVGEYDLPYGNGTSLGVGGLEADDSVQPYLEVKPGDLDYADALDAAQQRLAIFQSGTRPGEIFSAVGDESRYGTCPESADIVDPSVDGECTLVPIDTNAGTELRTGVPSQAHWVKLDLTQPPKLWLPRRSDWQSVLEDGVVSETLRGLCSGGSSDTSDVVALLANVKLDRAVVDFATTPVPMGLWKENPACNWSADPWKSKGRTLDDVRAADPRPWMQNLPVGTTGQSHVYMQSPGSAVFNQICINCHGPQFDSVGRLAENLATMTGGLARVADLRDGLFGPADAPGANRARVFPAPAAPDDPTADDWGARYLSWMALGGTNVQIPPAVVAMVSHTPFFGALRGVGLYAGSGGANMLTAAQGLCKDALLSAPTDPVKWGKGPSGFFDVREINSLLWQTGDAEMWLRLCSIDNPPPVVPFIYYSDTNGNYRVRAAYIEAADHHNGWGAAKPLVLKREVFDGPACASAGGAPPCPVGEENANVVPALTSQNLHPWCVVPPAGSGVAALFDTWSKTTCLGGSDCTNGKCTEIWPDANCVYPPICPSSVHESDLDTPEPAGWDDRAASTVDTWARRGAINAGLVVFSYLRGVMAGTLQVDPTFDACDQLAAK